MASLKIETARLSEEDLRDAWRKFTKFLLSDLLEGTKSDRLSVPSIPRQIWRFTKEGIVHEVESRPDYSSVLREGRGLLMASVEYRQLADLCNKEPMIVRHIGQHVATVHGGGTRELWDYAIVPAERLFGNAEPLAYDEQTFDRAFLDLMSFFHNDSVKFVYVVPLYDFYCDSDAVIRLDDKTFIRRVTDDEVSELFGDTELGRQVPLVRVLQTRYVAELVGESSKTIGKPSSQQTTKNPFDHIERLVTALRLVKPGHVSFDTIKIRPSVRIPGVFSGTFTRLTEPISNWGTVFSLDKADVEPLKAFWSEFRETDLKAATPLGVALRRFNFANGRVELEDALLDYMIALEALLLKDSGDSANVHKLSLRSAKLLGKTFEDRRRIYVETGEFYSKRNTLVHGGGLPVAADSVAQIENNLRQCIREMLVRLKRKGHNEMLTELDLA